MSCEPGTKVVQEEEVPEPVSELRPEFMGLSHSEAVALAERLEVNYRIVRVDDEYFPVTKDYRPERFNLEIDEGRVTKVTKG
ncbi:MAG: hypothetical protein AAGC74_07955 [Verrucomicrobiota bacterium]